jgi:hypothetical protein
VFGGTPYSATATTTTYMNDVQLLDVSQKAWTTYRNTGGFKGF